MHKSQVLYKVKEQRAAHSQREPVQKEGSAAYSICRAHEVDGFGAQDVQRHLEYTPGKRQRAAHCPNARLPNTAQDRIEYGPGPYGVWPKDKNSQAALRREYRGTWSDPRSQYSISCHVSTSPAETALEA